MRLPLVRFTVRRMMAGVLAVAAGWTCLMLASDVLAGVVLLVTFMGLAVSVLGVVYRRGEARASWLGFILLGWGYLGLASGYGLGRGTDQPELVTATALERLRPYLLRGQSRYLVPATVSRP